MPARDIFHAQIKHALIKDGWTITDDPLRLRWRSTDTYVDLGVEKLLAAQKGNQKIAVESKSFLGRSIVDDLEEAVGQYALYEELLKRLEPDRIVYLAISQQAYDNAFLDSIGEIFLESKRIRLLVVNIEAEVILQWLT